MSPTALRRLRAALRILLAAAMVGVFLAALLVASRRFSRHFQEYLLLRLDLARHVGNLVANHLVIFELFAKRLARASILQASTRRSKVVTVRCECVASALCVFLCLRLFLCLFVFFCSKL